MDFYSTCFVFALFVFVFSAITNRLFLKFSSNVGRRVVYNEGEVRWSSSQKPAFGGITFFIALLLSIVSFLLIYSDRAGEMNSREFFGFIFAAVFAFLTGLFDDAFNTRPLLKFACQILAAISIVFSGTVIYLCDSFFINAFFTVFWIVGIMNSINLLDNMDAIASVTVLGILAAILVLIAHAQIFELHYLYITIGLFAAIVGFLVFNWHPSKLFMGDSGSLFLGLTVAFLGIKFAWNAESILPNISATPDSFLFRRVFLALCIFILPITDTTSVFFKRIMAKRSPFKGGKDHTTHHLVYLGLRESLVACTFIFFSVIIVIAVYLMTPVFLEWNTFLSVAYAAGIVAVFSFFFIVANMNKNKDVYEIADENKDIENNKEISK